MNKLWISDGGCFVNIMIYFDAIMLSCVEYNVKWVPPFCALRMWGFVSKWWYECVLWYIVSIWLVYFWYIFSIWTVYFPFIIVYVDAIMLSCVIYDMLCFSIRWNKWGIDDVWDCILSEDWAGWIVFTDCVIWKS